MYNSFGKYKTTSQVQIFLGLCLACCFIFCSSNQVTYAIGHSYYEWGSFNGNANPVSEISPNAISLGSMIQQSFNTSITYIPNEYASNISYSIFLSTLEKYGLDLLLSNWDPYNPQFFVNIAYITGRVQYSNINRGYALYFTKFNGNVSPLTTISNDFIFFDSNNPIILDREFASILYPIARIGSEDNYSTYSSKSKFSQYGIGYNTNNTTSTFTSYNSTITYSINAFDNSAGNEFSKIYTNFLDFLNNDSIYTFIIYLPDTTSNWNIIARTYSNIGYSEHEGNTYWLFSTINIYNYNSNLYSLNLNSNYETIQFYYDVLSNSQIQDLSKILSIGYSTGSSSTPTPTPIPTFGLIYTPTPFPTNIFNPNVTPINLPLNPILQIGDYGKPWDFMKGIIPILHSALNSGTVHLFVQTIEYIYNSSLFYEVILFLIPSICLLAFILGRLKRK